MKKVLLIFCFILLGNSFSFADVENAKTVTREDLSNLFEKTLEYVNTNPQFIDEMINEIQNSPELKSLFESINQEEPIPSDIDFENRKVTDFLIEKINSSPEYVQKIILNFGQSKQFASELAQEDSIKGYLGKKVESDISFRKKLYMLLSKQERAALKEAINAPAPEETAPQEDAKKVEEEIKEEQKELK